MSAFGVYAEYYDLTYSDKDYASEAEFVHRLIQEYKPGANSILNLGCGTGRHDSALARLGYSVQGIDLSPKMIAVAQARKDQLPYSTQQRLHFLEADIRQARLNFRYDAVISLFHVFSYQTSDEDVRLTLNTALAHLVPGGICLFDFWYGPAVLKNPPEVRTKSFEDGRLRFERRTLPKLCPDENLVEVQFLFSTATDADVQQFSEMHRMRYFFGPEIQRLLEGVGLTLYRSREWLTDNLPSTNTWSVYALARLSTPS
jgi:SAM-dependent methyltransferase